MDNPRGKIQWWILGMDNYQTGYGRWHEIARELSIEDDVFYIHPVPLIQWLKRPKSEHKLYRNWSQQAHPSRGGILNCISKLAYYIPAFPKLWKIPGLWWLNEAAFGIWLSRQMKLRRVKKLPQVLITFPWALGPSLKMTPADLCVYDCSDNFRSYPGENTKMVDWAERRLCSNVQFAVVSSESFKARIQNFLTDVEWIPNGVRGSLASTKLCSVPELRKGLVLVYHGATQNWRFDWSLVIKIATARPDWKFRIYSKDKISQSLPGNVAVLPWLPHDHLPAVLQEASVGIMPYIEQEPTLSGFPLKMYEYMAAGIPVISTRLPEVAKYEPHVRVVAPDPKSFEHAIEEEARLDSSVRRSARKQLAAENTWAEHTMRYKKVVFGKLGRI